MSTIARPRRPAAVVVFVAVVAMLLGACGSARESTDRDPDIPLITGRPTPGTADDSADTTVSPTTPARTAPTVAPTAPVATLPPTRPLPTSVTTVAPTAPPATNAPTNPPTAPPATVGATRPPATNPPTTRPATTPAPTSLTTTTTIAVTPGEAVGCRAADIATSTGVVVGADVACRAGWAAANRTVCSDPAAACDTVDVFRVSGQGWIHDGRFDALSTCDFAASPLAAAGMSLTTAEALLGPCDTATPVDPVIVRPGATGPSVVAVQVALVGLGYPIATDGTYGPRTSAAVRDFQARNGLEVDGISGPATQHALGIGPPPAGSSPTSTITATTAPPTTVAPTTVSPTSAAPTTTVASIGPGEPRPCTTEAIGTDIGSAVTGTVECHAGWAVEVRPDCRGGSCANVEVYQLASIGWVHIGKFRMACAEGLTRSGMTLRVAASFADPCSTTLPPRTNIVPGSSGSVVANLQVALVAQGYVIGTDGTYGSRTEAAVRDWQQRNGLEVDGIAGPATQESLGL